MVSITNHSALELTGITQVFGRLVALSDVSMRVSDGERHAVLGANGAGKTTLFNVITGDVAPSSGRIRLFNEDVSALPPEERVRRGLRRTYQKTLLFGTLTILENLYLAVRGAAGGHKSFGRIRPDDPMLHTAQGLAREVGLEDLTHATVSQLAYGQQRQLEIGMALAGAPRLILFDEPAAGLSAVERGRLIKILENLPRSLGYLIIEHDLDVALKVADRVTILHNGVKLVEGDPEEIKNNEQVQAIYLGNEHG